MSSEVHEGQVLAGKFRIERVLGQGGMGVVVAATHLQLDQRVALKFLLPEALSNPEAVERFAREARAAVRIKSEHVARVSDVGTLESGSPYMVMEYLEGQDLAGWVRASGAMPVADAIEFLLQACEAIAEAHALGIVHRDLKPANLFVTRRADGTVCIKVLDFGISKLTVPGGGPDLGMTKTTSVMGSPLYMSPEQMSSTRNVDMRTDIWALGVILYEILSGRVPFEAETMPQLCGMILQDPPRPLRELRPDVPEAVSAVILRCLEKQRDRRFANVGELAAALAPLGSPSARRSAERISRVLGAAGIVSSRAAEVAAASTTPGESTSTNWGASEPVKKSRVPLLVGALAALLLLGGGGATLALLRKPAVTPPAAEPAPSSLANAASAATALPAAVPAAPTVQPELTQPVAPVASIAPAVSAPQPPGKAHAGAKPGVKPAGLKPAAATPKATVTSAQPAAIDPLEGRR